MLKMIVGIPVFVWTVVRRRNPELVLQISRLLFGLASPRLSKCKTVLFFGEGEGEWEWGGLLNNTNLCFLTVLYYWWL